MLTLLYFYQINSLESLDFINFSSYSTSVYSFFSINLANLLLVFTGKEFITFLENWTYLNDQPLNLSFVYSLKFSTSILFLIFIRAGVPRYRYDYLTKLGWSKFTVFCLFVFFFEYLIFTLI